MIFTLKRFVIIIFLLGILTAFNSCLYVGALIMSIDQKTTVGEWKSEKYKTHIQKRLGWAGPPYYRCRVKIKTLGGIYYRTIIKETFSREAFVTCIIKYPFRKDTIAVDVCKKVTFLVK